MNMQLCRSCGVTGNQSAFKFGKKICNDCFLQHNVSRKRYKEKYPEKWEKLFKNPKRIKRLARLYKCKESLIEALFLRTVICPICKKNDADSIDHCHETKQVRGFICRNCNWALGLLNDNVETILRCATYLMHEDFIKCRGFDD